MEGNKGMGIVISRDSSSLVGISGIEECNVERSRVSLHREHRWYIESRVLALGIGNIGRYKSRNDGLSVLG